MLVYLAMVEALSSQKAVKGKKVVIELLFVLVLLLEVCVIYAWKFVYCHWWLCNAYRFSVEGRPSLIAIEDPQVTF